MSDPNEKRPTYEVGYKRPPKHARFKPGQSGNRKGRPKGTYNLQRLIAHELTQKIDVQHNGKRRRMPVVKALAIRVVTESLKLNPKALAVVLPLLPSIDSTIEAAIPTITSEMTPAEAAAIWEAMVRRDR